VKLRTVRASWGFLIVALGLAGLFTAGNIGSEPDEGRFDPEFQTRLVLDGTSPAVILGLLLGMVLFTSEFRHGTITRTLLVVPRRNRLLAAKLLGGAAIGVGLFVLTLLVTACVAAIWLGILDVPLESGDVAEAVARGLAGAVIAGVAGAAVGGLVHSQVGALVGALLWIFLVEALVGVLLGLVDLDGVADYLPAATILGVAESNGGGLTSGGAAAVGLAWIALATVLAAVRTGRKDIT
jgi:ABC-2 type transport system permease protein